MAVNVDDKIRKLSSAQRKKVEARAAELMAEEMTLRDAARTQTHADSRRQKARVHPGQRLAAGAAQ